MGKNFGKCGKSSYRLRRYTAATDIIHHRTGAIEKEQTESLAFLTIIMLSLQEKIINGVQRSDVA